MNNQIDNELRSRSDNRCELCGSQISLTAWAIPPGAGDSADECVLLCQTCREQIEDKGKIDPNHWRCLNDSMWSQIPAVQVMAWRMLDRLRAEGWSQNLLDMLYLDDDTLAWAKSADDSADTDIPVHLDCNGAVLQSGDTVTLTKDLSVKGAGFTAKRGTAVRGISLVADDPGQIEGRVNGQRIVILTRFVKKSA